MQAQSAHLPAATFWFWAKSGADPVHFHPLVCHALDTMAVTSALWSRALTPAARERLAGGFGFAETEGGAWIGALAGAHDIGKASPTFQALWEEGRSNVEAQGLRFPGVPTTVAHGIVSTIVCGEELEQRGVPPEIAQALARAVGGHHGAFPTALDQRKVGRLALGDSLWHEYRSALLRGIFDLAGLPESSPTAAEDGAMARLAGLVSVADWIASDQALFPFGAHADQKPDQIDLASWMERARERAEAALSQVGWRAPPRAAHPRGFAELFAFSARAGQTAVEQTLSGISEPFLLILEDLTGAGKTEAAQMCIDLAMSRTGARGAYIALPTRATSEQAFRRLRGFLEGAYVGELTDLQLVHGAAQLSIDYEQLRAQDSGTVRPGGVYLAENDPGLGTVRASDWFAQRKRGLLSPFAVGTIDQALLAVLQARHFFVRLWGLADKVVVLDEVHAYDAYMSELLDRLIEWLGALDVTVIVLSATLPENRRAAIGDAYRRGRGGAGRKHLGSSASYPRLTLATMGRVETNSFAAARSRELGIRWINGDGALTEHVVSGVSGGGCVAVVCNTVDSAQRRFRELREELPGSASDGAPVVELLTARYRHLEREERERRCLQRFGPPTGETKRPRTAVLVATQVIEQSLDLDFDLMVSELAPVDLLIQRAGRLHRHERPRASRLAHPTLWVISPGTSGDVPQLDPGSAYIYAAHILLRTWLALRNEERIREPEDLDRLIEAVYAAADPPAGTGNALGAEWRGTASALDDELARKRREARLRAVGPPGREDGLLGGMLELAEEEDDPDLHPQLQALTRLGPPSVSAVLLRPDELAEERRNPQSRDDARALLRHSLRIGDQAAVAALRDSPVPTSWARNALLRNQRLVELDEAARWRCQKVELRLDSELGVVIGRTVEEDERGAV